jgi:hypothetical protein
MKRLFFYATLFAAATWLAFAELNPPSGGGNDGVASRAITNNQQSAWSSDGNVTLNGTANIAPNQTASAGASVMTRDLGDARYPRKTNVIMYPWVSAWGSSGATKGAGSNGFFWTVPTNSNSFIVQMLDPTQYSGTITTVWTLVITGGGETVPIQMSIREQNGFGVSYGGSSTVTTNLPSGSSSAYLSFTNTHTLTAPFTAVEFYLNPRLAGLTNTVQWWQQTTLR